MKIPVLADLADEINRLFIAGSKLSADDPRLGRLIPVLEKIGERAPVFKKLASETKMLTSSSAEGSGERLLALGTLLYSVLYTQGDAGNSGGEYAPLKTVPGVPPPDEMRTEYSYSRLQPLLDALTAQKPGRLEVIRSAYSAGFFGDLRTHCAAVNALDDSYAELASLLEKAIIPGIGPAVIPYLLARYDPAGNKGDGRRLALLGRLNYAGAETLAQEALDGNGTSIPVSVAAIEVLGKNQAFEPMLLALSRDKKKDLRAAALAALTGLDSADGKQILIDTFLGKDYKTSLEAVAACRDKVVKLTVLKAVMAMEAEVLAGGGEKKEIDSRKERFLLCAEALAQQPASEIIDYMRHILTNEKLRKAFGQNNWSLQNLYGKYLDGLDGLPPDQSSPLLKQLADNQALTKFYSYGVRLWFLKAAKSYPPREIYNEFCSHYSADHIDSEVFREAYLEGTRQKEIHERWIDKWLEGRNPRDKMLAIELADPRDKRQIKKLCGLLSKDLKDMETQKSRYVFFYFTALLEKIVDGGVNLAKQITPKEAQAILLSCGKNLTIQTLQALNAITETK
jgi:hypothetical protein